MNTKSNEPIKNTEYGYIVCYNMGFHVIKIKLSDFKYFTNKSICMYKEKSGFLGSIYNDIIFLSESDAHLYIALEPVKSYHLHELIEDHKNPIAYRRKKNNV